MTEEKKKIVREKCNVLFKVGVRSDKLYEGSSIEKTRFSRFKNNKEIAPIKDVDIEIIDANCNKYLDKAIEDTANNLKMLMRLNDK